MKLGRMNQLWQGDVARAELSKRCRHLERGWVAGWAILYRAVLSDRRRSGVHSYFMGFRWSCIAHVAQQFVTHAFCIR